jgi:hypothetical protein
MGCGAYLAVLPEEEAMSRNLLMGAALFGAMALAGVFAQPLAGQ